MRCRPHTSAIAIVVALGVGAIGTAGANGAPAATGTLDLRASLTMVSTLGACPPGVGDDVSACAPRTGHGLAPGLGRVTEAYTFLLALGPPCTALSGKALGYPVRLVVAGRGEIHLAVADGAQCVDQEAVRTQTQAFTVTGGTGLYEGASGSGAVERTLGGDTAAGRTGTETWKGTLVVPGLEFDITAPTIGGAVAKTVRAPRGAKRARVSYGVTALDTVDGVIPASCTPRSGSWFPIGRTVVTCTATDKSGNKRTARFTVTVRRR